MVTLGEFGTDPSSSAELRNSMVMTASLTSDQSNFHLLTDTESWCLVPPPLWDDPEAGIVFSELFGWYHLPNQAEGRWVTSLLAVYNQSEQHNDNWGELVKPLPAKRKEPTNLAHLLSVN